MEQKDCLALMDSASFAVLGTVDADRGTHLVPVVFAVHGDELVVPIDTVKPKGDKRLRRVENLLADRRASLLIDHRDDDWSELWWVRVDLEFDGMERPADSWRSRLGIKYSQYRSEGTIDALLMFTIRSILGWTAG
jgi:PPOX class probable F420-dependent enzyme